MNTRERIIESAARLFHERGFAATGVATILREAGVNSGSLYYFFSSKVELLKCVLQWYQENLYARIMQPIEAMEPDPLQRVLCLMNWYRDYLVDNHCRLGCPVGNLALEISDSHPELREYLAGNFDQWTRIIESWLIESGDQLPAGIDRHELARFVLTVMEGGVMQARATGDPQPYMDSILHLEHYLNLLSGEVQFAQYESQPAVARSA